jgi:cell division protein FtsN
MKKPGAVTGHRFVKGGFALGLVVGLLIGLALALGVALYITKAPVPFINKVPQRTVEQDQAEAERNKTWEPNAPLAPKGPRPVIGTTGAASGAVTGAPAPAAPASAAAPTAAKPATPPAATPAPAASAAKPGRDPAAILSGGVSTAPGADPFTYFLQVGAYTKADDAEAQRAKLAIQGFAAKVHEREQAGRSVYRVRLGPIEQKSEADALQARLQGAGLESQLVRVQKP